MKISWKSVGVVFLFWIIVFAIFLLPTSISLVIFAIVMLGAILVGVSFALYIVFAVLIFDELG